MKGQRPALNPYSEVAMRNGRSNRIEAGEFATLGDFVYTLGAGLIRFYNMSVINLPTLFYKLLEAKLLTGLCIQAVYRWHITVSK